MQQRKKPTLPAKPTTATKSKALSKVGAKHEFAALAPDARAELAVQRIRAHWRDAENEFIGIGRVLVDACYDGDEGAALEDDDDRNEILQAVTRSLGTLEGGPDRGVLSIARRIVAFQSVSRSNFFKLLPYSHKRALVQLPSAELVSEGAKRAAEFGWTVAQLDGWVRGKLKEAGKATQRRGARLSSTRRAVKALGQAADDKSLARIGAEYGKLDDKARAAIRAEAEAAAESLARLRKTLADLERSLGRADR